MKLMKIVRKYNYVPVEVSRVRFPNLVWKSDSIRETDKEFVNKYSVIIPESEFFSEVDIDADSEGSAFADRYGGYGGASNGGGARCVNLDGRQIKGVGANKLLGKSVINSWYSHGTLNIVDAVCEVIYSNILSEILPCGVVECHGLVLLAKESSFYGEDITSISDAERCWGALIVRDECVRPAHFLRARNYIPLDEWKWQLQSDVVRVRGISKAVDNELGDRLKFVEHLSKVVRAQANQFAFAKAARIIHGSTTSSNLTVDGAWIDFAATTFLPTGKNFQTGTNQEPFQDEWRNVEDIVVEYADTHTKFNNYDIHIDPLLTYYNEAMDFYFHKHSAYVLGVSYEKWPEYNVNNDADVVSRVMHDIIHLNKEAIVGSPDGYYDDPMLSLLFAVYGSCLSIKVSKRGLQEYLDDNDRVEELCESFLRLSKDVFAEAPDGTVSRDLIRAVIVSYRQTICSSFFYRGRLRRQLSETLHLADSHYYSSYIETALAVGEFCYEAPGSERVYLFSSGELSVSYCTSSGKFCICDAVGEENYFYTYSECYVEICKIDKKQFEVGGFNFLVLFDQLCLVLS
ncbi:hypothetical protein [Teredinibacter purpureus]|uniref:hypothetical protein n=1 Tax=Teredinibacter purpureus TaxID=2731756 RepID=UPI0005F7A34B|nr:hypothetical protein [Teredinibacter purpureus]